MTSSLTNPPLGRDLAAAAQEPASQTRVVAGSLATGLVAALLLVAAPFTPARENAITGAVLCGFALGCVDDA
jgi:hypothetical protein